MSAIELRRILKAIGDVAELLVAPGAAGVNAAIRMFPGKVSIDNLLSIGAVGVDAGTVTDIVAIFFGG